MESKEQHIDQFSQAYASQDGYNFVETQNFLNDLIGNHPSYFRTPHNVFLDLKRKFFSFFVTYFNFKNVYSLASDKGTSYFYWKSIIDYLFLKKLIKEPFFSFGNIFNDEPKVYDVSLVPFIEKTDGHVPAFFSKGRSMDFHEAASKAVGEFLERYFFVVYDTYSFLGASIKELQKKNRYFLNPLKYQIFSDEQKEQFPNYRFSDEHFFYWVKGAELVSGRCAYIPSQMIFWNYRFEKEPILRQPITSGAGGMFTEEGAIISGVYELIERDTFLSHWLLAESPDVIDLSSVRSQKVHALIKECQRYGIEVILLRGRNDIGIPVFFVVLKDLFETGPSVTMGASSNFDQDRAIYQAINESLSVRHSLRSQTRQANLLSKDYKPFSDLKINQVERLLLWSRWEMRDKIDFFITGPKSAMDYSVEKKFFSSKEELDFLVSLIKDKKMGEVFVYTVKNKILSKLGYYVVKVLIPGLLPMYLDEKFACVGSNRLETMRTFFGKSKDTPVNPIPHPFP